MVQTLSENLDENFEYFLVHAQKTGCVWGLEGDEGFALCDSTHNEAISVMPFWSEPEHAQVHCVDAWAIYKPVPIALEELLDDWLEGMHNDVLLVGINWDHELQGDEIEPLDLLEAFEQRL